VMDIGCDHGLLSYGLAASGIYSRVLGIDVFMQALKYALDNQHHVYKHSYSSHKNCTLEFQLGSGLESVKYYTLDAVCDGVPQGKSLAHHSSPTSQMPSSRQQSLPKLFAMLLQIVHHIKD